MNDKMLELWLKNSMVSSACVVGDGDAIAQGWKISTGSFSNGSF